MPEYLTTREVADLLRIKERKVYDLAASASIPHTKAMGKLLFPRDAIDQWLSQASAGQEAVAKAKRPSVFLGSHDPLLDWALLQSDCGIAALFNGSNDGLDRFAQRQGIATGLHLYDAAANSWNVNAVANRFADTGTVMVGWAERERGLIVSEAKQDKIKQLSDIQGCRFTPRQAGAGAQNLFLHLAEQAGLDLSLVSLGQPVLTEADSALAVLEGEADATFGLATLAAQFKLPFVPLVQERFDLLIDRHAWFEPPMQTFWAFCRSKAFAERAARLTGYDVSELGMVRFNSA
ncbi:MAG: substrate-binding domain-containing protein [Burkholderiaceae bacterium]